jgi:glycosyltransferase involved in cell wall biosynthesis
VKPETERVTAIVTAFECARYLSEAIDSVLAQTVRIDEVLVVDDGSTDGCASVVEGFGSRVRGIRQPHSGIGRARNRGLEEARGGWIAFLDGDDVWEREKTELQMRVAGNNPDADLIFGLAQNFVTPDVDPAVAVRWHATKGLAAAVVAGGMLGKRSAIDRVGAFRTDLRVGEFVDWLIRARELGLSEQIVPRLVLHRRLHGGNTTLREPAASSDYARLLKASLDRRRAGA